MATYYVYAPVTGKVTSLDVYYDEVTCAPGLAHPVCKSGFKNPIDIGVDGVRQPIYFYGSANVAYIKTTYCTDCVCKDSGVPAPWDAGVQADIYKTGDVSIGSVFFAHVENPPADGKHSGTYPMGWVPYNPAPPGYTCYGGMHTHIEQKKGSRRPLSCHQHLAAGTDWVYKWVV